MSNLEQEAHDFKILIEILLFFTALFFLLSLLMFIITYIKRIRRIKSESLKTEYQNIIDNVLFTYLFSEEDNSDTDITEFKHNFDTNVLFQKVAVKAVVALKHNYSGEFKTKLEMFYVSYGLSKYSMKKLNSKKWYKKIEGIKDLSNLNYQPAFEKIKACLTHKNKLVQEEALIAILKMRGINELILQKDSNIFLNDWIQSNIIFTIKTNKINEVDNLIDLLESKNESMQLLGVRIISYFRDSSYLQKLKELEKQTHNLKLKSEINFTVNYLNNYYTT